MSLETRCVNGTGTHLIIHLHGLPHCPRNRSHIAHITKGKGGRMVASIMRTEAAHSYEAALLQHLAKYRSMAELFFSNFNPKTDHLVAEWEFSSPGVNTKAGALSQNGVDLDAHKVLQDTIMGFIGIDDAYIKKDVREKFEGDYRVSLELKIRQNNGAHFL